MKMTTIKNEIDNKCKIKIRNSYNEFAILPSNMGVLLLHPNANS